MRARTTTGLLVVLTLLALPALAAAQDGPEAAMLARINQLRSEAGLPQLVRDQRLDGAARAHTLDMATRGELFHVSETTGTPIDRAHAAGVDSSDIAENVAMHSTIDSAQASLEASEAHLANMLSPRSTHIGLSAVSASGGVYVTQLYAHLDVPASAPASDSVIAMDVPVPTTPTEAAPAPPAETPAAPSEPVQTTPPPPTGDGAIVIPPDPSGVVRVPPPAPGVAGYWICAAGRTGSRWYYYPVRPGVTGALSADLSVSGPPPGYAADSCGGATAGARAAVPPGSSTYGSSPTAPAATGGRAIITPWGTVRVETRPRRR